MYSVNLSVLVTVLDVMCCSMSKFSELVNHSILLYLEVEDIVRCAAIGKSWYSCLKCEDLASKVGIKSDKSKSPISKSIMTCEHYTSVLSSSDFLEIILQFWG